MRYANNEYAKAQAAAGNPSAQLAMAGLNASQNKFSNMRQGLSGLRSAPTSSPASSYGKMAPAQSDGPVSLPRRPLPAPSRPTTGRDVDPGFYKPMPKPTSGNVSRLNPAYYNNYEVQQMEAGERARIAEIERNNARNAAMAETKLQWMQQNTGQAKPIYKRGRQQKSQAGLRSM